MADVSLAGLRKKFGDAEVIHGMDLEVGRGEFAVLVGPSGCGKSTLLRMIAGLEEITAGEIRIDGVLCNDLEPKARGVAMVFQSYAIFPHMTVRENMAFGLTIAKTPKAEKEARTLEAARILRMEDLLDRRPAQLSGGQRQRVAIGRAIVRKPKVFLFDEPLSNLDASLRADMRVELGKLHAALGATMIYVTHDQVEAMTLADRVAALSDGKVEQQGPPLELYENPANLFVATFLGSPRMNILPCADAGGSRARLAGGFEAETSRPRADGEARRIGVRPEHVRLSDADGIPGKISVAEHLGADTFLHVETASGDALLVRAPADCGANPGDTVRLRFAPEHVHLFDQDDKALTRKRENGK